ncbi:uncharacterized protein LOC128679694 [Plodia interpunctella]|uniref:uncharacterized protein LOC128679694 n=1 Tax=Plodia interpunctella TaxID=58824 RepID=UPI0023679232|nr:uncharacterized protein LOC128679694 [Plodia interpunctella]
MNKQNVLTICHFIVSRKNLKKYLNLGHQFRKIPVRKQTGNTIIFLPESFCKMSGQGQSDLNILQKNFVVPVQTTDLTLFDDAFLNMKERFAAEMKRMEQETTRFSNNLMCLYGHTTSATSALSSAQRERTSAPTMLESITNSPLIEGEGEVKTLKLQFDVSSFDPSEVKVKIVEDFLIVSATHQEKSDNSTVFREYHKEILMPKGVNPQDVISSLSKDGVLTVQTPLPKEALRMVSNPSVK